MTLGAWLATRTPEPPPALRRRLEELVDQTVGLDAEADGIPPQFVSLAAVHVEEMLREGRTGRESALDLLAADALVTYAFEAAADDPARIGAYAQAALHLLGSITAEHAT